MVNQDSGTAAYQTKGIRENRTMWIARIRAVRLPWKRGSLVTLDMLTLPPSSETTVRLTRWDSSQHIVWSRGFSSELPFLRWLTQKVGQCWTVTVESGWATSAWQVS